MAEALLQILLENLNSLIHNEFGSLLGLDRELKTIRAIVEDAEEKQLTDKAIQNWLKKLNDAAYDADDILDDWASRLGHDSRSALNQVTTCSTKHFSPARILFRHQIANRLKDVMKRIDEIAGERMKFHLREAAAVADTVKRQTGSILTQPEVYGREGDKEKAVECLVKLVSDCPHLSVYSIVGMGGLGKTTLAQLVFNDERICRHFELRIWVCVSDEFGVKTLIKAIIESASGTCCGASDMDPLQRLLQETLKGKRFLLVLDDVWSEDQEKWDMLKCVLACGSKGACVVVTTRLEKVSSVVRTLPVHHLSCLSRDDCWSLFRQRAFGNDAEERPQLVAIGKEIVNKCGGVPLAAKALGGLMRFKSEENEWLRVKESQVWDLPPEENSILPSLRLSYSSLPLDLRRCFAYCAIFPKDSAIDKQKLVHLWMANGFVSSDGRLEMEDVGNQIWNELHWRSLFQDVQKDEYGNIVSFKMHDLVHDLAQSVVKGEYYLQCSSNPITFSSSRVRHVNISGWPVGVDRQVAKKLKSVRTVLGLPDSLLGFSRSHVYRALAMRGRRLPYLPSSIGRLKHLRYLDFSSVYIRFLPNSICSLLNLQTLKLSHCWSLEKLPKHMRRLKNLRHLYLDDCCRLQHMPPDMGQITCLQTLSLFVVDRKRGCGLSELQNLNLRGVLKIRKLERVQIVGDAKEAKLLNKQNLRHLTLSWSYDVSSERQEEVLEGLEPHPNLQELVVSGYKGVNFPRWMKSPCILNNIVTLTLDGCSNCSLLPQLWKLPCLKELSVFEADYLEYICNDRESEGVMFPSLESLSIKWLQNLKGLSRQQGIQIFPRVTKLDIGLCPKLILPNLPFVKDLCLGSSNKLLLNSISNLRGLTCLAIRENDDVDSFPGVVLQNMTALQSLRLENFTKLEKWSKDPISLNSLKSLEFVHCPELESFSGQGWQGMSSLQSLSIVGCKKLKSLSEGEGEGLQHLTALERLNIQGCPKLVMLPDSVKYLGTLRWLGISGLPLNANEPSSSQMVAMPEALQHIPGLERMAITGHPHLASLPDWIGNLTSLQTLSIRKCSRLTCLPSSILRLSNLQTLSISECPQLQRRCEKEKGSSCFINQGK